MNDAARAHPSSLASGRLRSSTVRRIAATLGVASLVGLLAKRAAEFYPFIADDALISLVYARRLLAGAGLTWSDGQRVEGYTNFLWVILTALLGVFRIDGVTAARLLDFLGVAAALVATGYRPEDGRIDPWRLAGGGLFLATSGSVAIWAIGGLEHGFMLGPLAWAVVLLLRHQVTRARRPLIASSALCAVLALTRADGLLYTGVLALGALATGPLRWRTLRNAALFAAAPVAAVGLQLGFRLIYYGQWVPNTVLAKVSFNAQRYDAGVVYVGNFFKTYEPIADAAAVAAVVALLGRRWRRVLVSALLLGAVSAYVVSIGGDFFPGYRPMLFALVPLALLVSEATGVVWTAVRAGRWRWAKAAILCAGIAAWARTVWAEVPKEFADPLVNQGVRERWEWNGHSLAQVLKTAFAAGDPLIAVDSAGALPYWTGFRAIDMLGLNDLYLTHHLPENFGHGAMGHEIGDGRYVLSRRPDLVVFCHAFGEPRACFLGGHQMLADPRFLRDYRAVRILTELEPVTHATVFMDTQSPRVGIRRTPDRIVIPGYLIGESGPEATLDREGRLGISVAASTPLEVRGVMVPAGTWDIRAEPDARDVRIEPRCAGRTMAGRGAPSAHATVALDRPTHLDLAVGARPGTAPVRIAELRLTRHTGTVSISLRCSGREPLTVSPAALAEEAEPGTFWEAPGAILIDERGLTVRYPTAVAPLGVTLQADANDVYRLQPSAGDRLLEPLIVPAVPGPGLKSRSLAAPASWTPFDTLAVTPISGDGHYSVSGLSLDGARSRESPTPGSREPRH